MQIEQWPIARPIPYSRNPRNNDGPAVEKVAASLQAFGWQQPIVVDRDGTIICGHTRHRAAHKLGMTEVPVLIAGDLTPAQVRAYRLADNRTNQEATWVDDLLSLELDELQISDFDLTLTGFDPEELAKFFSNGIEEGLTEDDACPEAPDDPKSVPGDVWLLGAHRLMCGDSTAVTDVDTLLDGAKANFCYIDPPYGISMQMNNPGTTCKETILGDTTTDVATAAYNLCAAFDVPMIFWGANHYIADAGLPNASCWLCWNKQESSNHIDQADGEFAWTNLKGPARVFNHLWAGFRRDSEKGETRVHPTQKPIALTVEILDFFKADNIVLDLFGGSGSTLIACEKTGRSCRMMELDTQYVDVILHRWQNYTGKKAIHQDGTYFDAR
jgi:DNA methylase/ParB-like nuclease domain